MVSKHIDETILRSKTYMFYNSYLMILKIIAVKSYSMRSSKRLIFAFEGFIINKVSLKIDNSCFCVV